ncbi:VOC family protein [bacterium]|nr:VOC family protein [bacterium]
MRLRQIAFAAHDRDRVVADLAAVLAIEVSFNDPGVAVFGLCNAVLPVGDTFLEVVAPTAPDSAAGRYLARRGGDCGYMVMVQVEDTDAARRRAAAQGARIVWSIDLDDISGTHFHPRDLGGALLSVDTPRPPAAWRWAGADWARHRRTAVVDRLAAVDMACADPAATAARWASLLDRRPERRGGAHEIALDAGRLRFLPGAAAGEDGVVAIDLHATDAAAAVAAAAARGLAHGDDWVRICGTTLRLA